MTCPHARRERSTVEAEVPGVGWIPSTVYERCADCGAMLCIGCSPAAFQIELTPRRVGPWVPYQPEVKDGS